MRTSFHTDEWLSPERLPVRAVFRALPNCKSPYLEFSFASCLARNSRNRSVIKTIFSQEEIQQVLRNSSLFSKSMFTDNSNYYMKIFCIFSFNIFSFFWCNSPSFLASLLQIHFDSMMVLLSLLQAAENSKPV